MAKSRDIETGRLLITPFTDRHLTERYVAWLNNPHLMRYSEQRHRTHTFQSCRAYMESFDGTSNYFWAIEEKQVGLGHIGNMNAYVDHNNQIADLGILIGEDAATRKGYALEAWLAVCDYLLRELGFRKITAGTLTANQQMIKLARRAQMIEDGVRRRQCLFSGAEVDVLHFALFREDWSGAAACLQR